MKNTEEHRLKANIFTLNSNNNKKLTHEVQELKCVLKIIHIFAFDYIINELNGPR